MSTTHEQQIAVLTDKLNALENESRRILRALNWSSKVRMILFLSLLLFVLVSLSLFYLLYLDIKNNRIAQVQKIISDQPAEFSEPLMAQIKLLADEEGPFVADVFRQKAQEDSQLYVQAFDAERTILVTNLQTDLEAKLKQSYAAMLDEQEGMLKEEFPALKDPEKLENLRNNMEKVYEKVGQRYYVEYLKDEMQKITDRLDRFPASDPKQDSVPIGEQIATEFLELVRMMVVNADHYHVPTDIVEVDPEFAARTAASMKAIDEKGAAQESAAADDDKTEKPAAVPDADKPADTKAKSDDPDKESTDDKAKVADDKKSDGDKSDGDKSDGDKSDGDKSDGEADNDK